VSSERRRFPFDEFSAGLVDVGERSSGAKARSSFGRFSARLKSCPFKACRSRGLSKLVEVVPFHEAYGSRALSGSVSKPRVIGHFSL
jgi:hypothetical protein